MWFSKLFSKLKEFSLVSLMGWMGGRHFVLAGWFSFTAFYLANHSLLTREYAATICAIQGFMTMRSMHDDKKEVAMKTSDDDKEVALKTSDDKKVVALNTSDNDKKVALKTCDNDDDADDHDHGDDDSKGVTTDSGDAVGSCGDKG